MENIIIGIGLKGYLREFLIGCYGLDKDGCLHISWHNWFGLLVVKFLERLPVGRVHHKIQDGDLLLSLKGVYQFVERTDIYMVTYNYMSDENRAIIAGVVGEHFKGVFFTWMDFYQFKNLEMYQFKNVAGAGEDVSRKDAKTQRVFIKGLIERFCVEHGISEDAGDYELLKKMYYRYRKLKIENGKWKIGVERVKGKMSEGGEYGFKEMGNLSFNGMGD